MEPTITILQEFGGITIGNYICHACRGTTSKTEYTPQYILIFLLKGSFRDNSFGLSSLLTSEQIIFKKPNFEYTVVHEHYIQDDCLFIEFGDQVLEHLATTFSEPVNEFLKHRDRPVLLLQNDPWKHAISWHLAKERSHGDTLSFEQIALSLIESTLSSQNLPVRPIDSVLHDGIDKAKQYIGQHFQEDISLMEIADAAHISPYHFSRVFKQETNFSPHQFLMNVRIEHACMHLSNCSNAVNEICYHSGFNNPDYFIYLFKKKKGLTPGQYRLKYGSY